MVWLCPRGVPFGLSLFDGVHRDTDAIHGRASRQLSTFMYRSAIILAVKKATYNG